MYAARIFIKAEDGELDDLDTFADKAAKNHKGTWHARSYDHQSNIREHSWGFSRQTSAKAWVREVKEFVSNVEDLTYKRSTIRKIPI